MPIKPVVIACLLIGLLMSASACQQTSYDAADMEARSVQFITTYLSDGAPADMPAADLLAKDSTSLHTMMTLRKDLKNVSDIADMRLVQHDVKTVEIKALNEHTLDIFIEMREDNSIKGGDDIDQQRYNVYRLLWVKENDQWQVLKAIVDDYTGSAITPDLIANPEAFRAYDFSTYDATIAAVNAQAELAAAAERHAAQETRQALHDAEEHAFDTAVTAAHAHASE